MPLKDKYGIELLGRSGEVNWEVFSCVMVANSLQNFMSYNC